MRRKFIAAVTSGVLALTVMAALPTHAEAVSIWLDLTPGTESVETFQYKDYADRYSDAYKLYGYDAEALFNHYETVGKAENRVGRFKKTPEEDDRHPYVWDADEPLDPLPPLDFHAQPDWFDGAQRIRLAHVWWRRWESNPCPKRVQRRCLRVQAIYNIPSASRRSSG